MKRMLFLWLIGFSVFTVNLGMLIKVSTLPEFAVMFGIALLFVCAFDKLLDSALDSDRVNRLTNDLLTERKENTKLQAEIDRLTITNMYLVKAEQRKKPSTIRRTWSVM